MGSPKVYNKRMNNAPLDAVYVGRPTVFGNHYVVHVHGTQADCAKRYLKWLRSTNAGKAMADIAKVELKGKDLVCWCVDGHTGEDEITCHGQALLIVANEE